MALTEYQLETIEQLPEHKRNFMNKQKAIEAEGSRLHNNFFMPADGICWNCKADLIEDELKKGNDGSEFVTGCTRCCKSYCD